MNTNTIIGEAVDNHIAKEMMINGMNLIKKRRKMNALIEKQSHPAQQSRVEHEIYFVFGGEGEENKDRETILNKMNFIFCVSSLL